MFVILLNYISTLEEIDNHMAEHVQFLKKYYENGFFIASGRKVPRTGGVILALAKKKEEIEMILKEDPFYRYKLARFELIEFNTSMVCDELKMLVDKY